jgi:hypothetical protein
MRHLTEPTSRSSLVACTRLRKQLSRQWDTFIREQNPLHIAVATAAITIFETTVMPSIILMEGGLVLVDSLADRVRYVFTRKPCNTTGPHIIAMDVFKDLVSCYFCGAVHFIYGMGASIILISCPRTEVN